MFPSIYESPSKERDVTVKQEAEKDESMESVEQKPQISKFFSRMKHYALYISYHSHCIIPTQNGSVCMSIVRLCHCDG